MADTILDDIQNELEELAESADILRDGGTRGQQKEIDRLAKRLTAAHRRILDKLNPVYGAIVISSVIYSILPILDHYCQASDPNQPENWLH